MVVENVPHSIGFASCGCLGAHARAGRALRATALGPFNFSGASSERPQLRLGAGMGHFVHGGLRRRVGSSDIRLVSAVRAAGDGPACFFKVPHSAHLLAAARSNENSRSRDALFLMGVGTLVLWRCRGVSSLRAWPKTTTHPMLWKVRSLLMAQPS